MNERKEHKGPVEDPTIIGHDRSGKPLSRQVVSQLLSRDLTIQGELACGCVDRFGIKPQEVFSLLTEDSAKDQFKIWCIGRGIELEEDKNLDPEQKQKRAYHLLGSDSEIIDKLSPYLTRAELARILAIKKYRDAATGNDQKTLMTLYGVTYRLLDDYLGPRRYYKRDNERVAPTALPELPAEIYQDEIIYQILIQSQKQATRPFYCEGSEACFNYLGSLTTQATTPEQKQIIEDVATHFRGSDAMAVPSRMKRQIAGSQRDIPDQEQTQQFSFPAQHQRDFAYSLSTKELGPIDLLNGHPGTQKTRAVVLGLKVTAEKDMGGNHTLVFCPSGKPREDWVEEIKDSFEDQPDIASIGSVKELKKFIEEKKKPEFTVIGYGLLSELGIKPGSFELLSKLVQNAGFDSLVADEVQLINNTDASCTQLMHFISRQLPEKAPRIAMTGTLIVNGTEDADSPVRILLPFDYRSPGDFTRSVRNEPYTVSALLYGKELITRWDKELILRDQLPPIERTEVAVPLSLFHQRLYDFVYADNLPEGRTKRQILMQLSLDPLLVKKYYSPEGINEQIAKLRKRQEEKRDEREKEIIERMIEGLEGKSLSISSMLSATDAAGQLSDAYEKFIDWKLSQNPNEVFNEDFLVRIGFDTLAFWSFFYLSRGMDTLVSLADDPFIRADWVSKDGLYSSKYRILKEIMDPLIAEGKTKIRISSGVYKTSVTTASDDFEDSLEEEDTEVIKSLYDHLGSWYGPEKVLRIDGDVSAVPKKGEISDRSRTVTMYRQDPGYLILLHTTRSSRLGINLGIPPTEKNSHIDGLLHIRLDDPETHADKFQDEGRDWRPGQIIPIESRTLRATHAEYPGILRYGLIDQGRAEALEYKRLIAQMVEDCVPLTDSEEEFVRSHMRGTMVQSLYPETPRQYLINKFFPKVRGRGYKENREFLRQIGFEGMINANFFAAYYAVDDEFSLAGHNARVVSRMIKQFQEATGKEGCRIGSVGAGAAILQVVTGSPIVNIDMMEEILRVGKDRQTIGGHFVVGEAANLPIRDGAFPVRDDSLYIHWTNNIRRIREDGVLISEREEGLLENNRTVEEGAVSTISLPHSYLTPEQFANWRKALEEYFGFTLAPNLPSGLVMATDYKRETISWIFNLIKTGPPKAGCDNQLLRLDSDPDYGTIDPSSEGEGFRVITINPPLPHREFEIIQPETGEKEKITFGTSEIEEEIDRILKERSHLWTAGIEVLRDLGIEEYGMLRKLMREARSRWNLTAEEAEKLSLDVIDFWSRDGYEKNNAKSIYNELRFVMMQMQQGRN